MESPRKLTTPLIIAGMLVPARRVGEAPGDPTPAWPETRNESSPVMIHGNVEVHYVDGEYSRRMIESSEVPEADLKLDRHATEVGEIGVVETADGPETPVRHDVVQHAEGDERSRREDPALGTIATTQGMNA